MELDDEEILSNPIATLSEKCILKSKSSHDTQE